MGTYSGSRKKKKAHYTGCGKKTKCKRFDRMADQVADDVINDDQNFLKQKVADSMDIVDLKLLDNKNVSNKVQYCTPCVRYFVNSSSYESHIKTKKHKQTVKSLKKTPVYSQEESLRAAGLMGGLGSEFIGRQIDQLERINNKLSEE